MRDVLGGAVAAFIACVVFWALYEAIWAFRHHRKPPARAVPPAPGPEPGAGAVGPPPVNTPSESPGRHAPAPDLHERIDVRLLGRPVVMVNFYDSGATVTYDLRHGTRTVDLPPADEWGIGDFLSSEDAP